MIPEMPDTAWGMFDQAVPPDHRMKIMPHLTYSGSMPRFHDFYVTGTQPNVRRYSMLMCPDKYIHFGQLLILCDWLYETLGDDYEPMLTRTQAFLRFVNFVFHKRKLSLNPVNAQHLSFRIFHEEEIGTIVSKTGVFHSDKNREPIPHNYVDMGTPSANLRPYVRDSNGVFVDGSFSFHEQLAGFIYVYLPDAPHWWKEVKDDQVIPFMARYMQEWEDDEYAPP